MPDTAERITDSGDTEGVPVSDLDEDDLVLVRPGASVPADGVIEEGDSDVEESMSTVIVAINAQLLRRVDLTIPGLPGVPPSADAQAAD